MGAPDVPPRTRFEVSTRRLTPALPPLVGPRGHAQTPAILDHSNALPQGDGSARPAFAGSAEGGERNLIVFDASDVLDDAFAVRCPGIDPEGEVSPRFGLRVCHRRQSSSASRLTAGAAGFLILTQSCERPER